MKTFRTALAAGALMALAACSSPSTPPADCASGADCTTGPGGLPPGFVRLADVDPTILQEMRYPTEHNFIGDPVAGYEAADCWLTQPAAEALRRAQKKAMRRGYTLKVYDCYRPQRAVSNFMSWAAGPDERMKPEFYPDVEKSRIIPDGYVAEKSGHSRGSTVDLTLVESPGRVSRPWSPEDGLQDCRLPAAQRFPDTSIDMGTGFDCFDPKAHTASTAITAKQKANRRELVSLLAQQGFTNYPEEWWHYTLDGEPYPDTYFDVPMTPANVPGPAVSTS